MSEDNKTIQEALAEVQKNAELKRIQEAKKAWGDALQVDEAMVAAPPPTFDPPAISGQKMAGTIKRSGQASGRFVQPQRATASSSTPKTPSRALVPSGGRTPTATTSSAPSGSKALTRTGGSSVSAAGETASKTGFAGKLPTEHGFRAHSIPGSGAAAGRAGMGRALARFAGGPVVAGALTAAEVMTPGDTNEKIPELDRQKLYGEKPKTPYKGPTLSPEKGIVLPGTPAAKAQSGSKEVPTIKAPAGPAKVAAPKVAAPAKPATSGAPKASTTSTATTTKGGYFLKSPNVSKGDYTIKKGDTLSGIAKAQGTSVGAIQSMNKGLTDVNKIAAGGSLNLPTATKSSAAPSTSTATTPATTTPKTTNVTPPKPKEDTGVVARRDIRQGSQDMLGGVIDAVRREPGSGERFKSGASQLGTGFKEAGQHAVDLAKGALASASSSLGKNAEQQRSKPEYESGGKKEKKKMSEDTNPLIASFLALQEKNPSNMFEAAKKLSKKQDEKLDVVDDDKIDAKDLAALRAGKKKVDEANIDPVVTGSSSVTKDPKKYVDPSTPKVPYSELPKPGNAAGDVLSKAKNALDKTGVKEETEEEVTFSQAEIDHINSFFLEASVAPNRPEVATGADSTSDKMSQNDVTGTAESGKRIRKEEVELDEVKTMSASGAHYPWMNKPKVTADAAKKSQDYYAWAKAERAKNDAAKAAEKKTTKEEVEQIYELDDDTMRNAYVQAKKRGKTDQAMRIGNMLGKRSVSPNSDKVANPFPVHRGSSDPIYKEEVELDEGDLTIRTLYNKWADHTTSQQPNSGTKANAVEKAITKVHGPKVMGHLKKALSANLRGNFDGEESHFEKARSAAGKSEMLGATVGSGRSEFRRTHEEIELEEGRPKKNPTPETTERDPRQHIQVQAGRAAAGNVIDFHHNDGTKSKITPAMGRRITAHLNGLKPADRQTAVNKMHDSAEGLKV